MDTPKYKTLILKSLLLLLPLISIHAWAEICWEYTDLEPAKVPLKCVEQGDLTTPCTWDPECNTDGDPSDCCVSVADPGASQTIGDMHLTWHTCMGNTATENAPGGLFVDPSPPGRGQRWYAFHRQLEWDFNEFRADEGYGKIDALEWCPGMDMPYGHYGANISGHPKGCGTGPNRPNSTVMNPITCTNCIPFDSCLYMTGAGPSACTASVGCSANGKVFPYTSLDDFPNAEEISQLLDAHFHGNMHEAIGFADGGGYNADASDPSCSTRDGMFWRLHKALDEVIRVWQDDKAVDVTLVIDRSGSMGGASGTGVGTRLDNAKEAADMFADLMEEGRSDGGVNRLGVVSYANNASNAALNMPLDDVDGTLRDAGGPFDTLLSALSPGGATSIGSGIVGALGQLCPGGDCSGFIAPPGGNQRKAILLLTDGRENTAPCLEAGCEFGGGGAEIDYSDLDATQLCAVGLGNAAAVDGDLLTILAERQGGIYMNNTDATGNDLKDFFAKCFAQLTDEFIGLDPQGLLAASQSATEIMPYSSCDEGRITFTSGWTNSDKAADKLQLLVNAPNGDPWVAAPFYGEMSDEQSWAFKRSPLPYQGQDSGLWTMQLVRPQSNFVNGFSSDSFAQVEDGAKLVRKQIQRLCPVGEGGRKSCHRVLYYEDKTLNDSAYKYALEKAKAFTVGDVTSVSSPEKLKDYLRKPWDLIVYASQVEEAKDYPSDDILASLLCQGQKSIITEMRQTKGANAILNCAGATRDRENQNFELLTADADFLDLKVKLKNPGRKVYSFALQAAYSNKSLSISPDAHYESRPHTAVIGRSLKGSDLNWHANVLVKGLTKLSPFVPFSVPKTGDNLQAAVRILPSIRRAGGYPGGKMIVEVERPTRGLGGLVKRTYPIDSVRKDPIDSLELQLNQLKIPTVTERYELNDEGRNGDENPLNGTYTTNLPFGAGVDGMYTFYFKFDYPVGSCLAHRELKHSVFVDVRVSPKHSSLQIGQPTSTHQGTLYPVSLYPRDALDNQVGPGRKPKPQCTSPCECHVKEVVDHNDGSYTIPVLAPKGLPITECKLEVFDTLMPLEQAKRVFTKAVDEVDTKAVLTTPIVKTPVVNTTTSKELLDSSRLQLMQQEER